MEYSAAVVNNWIVFFCLQPDMQNQFKWESHGSGLMTGLLQETRTHKHVFHSLSISYLKNDEWLFLCSLQVLLLCPSAKTTQRENVCVCVCACAVIKWGLQRSFCGRKQPQASRTADSQPLNPSAPQEIEREFSVHVCMHTFEPSLLLSFTHLYRFLLFLTHSSIGGEWIWQPGLENMKQICEWMEDGFKMLGEGGLMSRRDSL